MNLSGGFHDAGDHVKFGLPQSYAAAVLGWGMYEFPQAYKATGTWNHAMDEMKWFSDYFLRSTFLNPSGQVVAFAYQVGEGSCRPRLLGPVRAAEPDARTRGRPTSRPAQTPAADQTASAAAALAVEAILTASSDASYSAKCLKYAAGAVHVRPWPTRAPATPAASTTPAGTWSKEAWAADWLYLATGNFSYVNDIIATNSSRRVHRLPRQHRHQPRLDLAEHLGDELGLTLGRGVLAARPDRRRATRTCPPSCRPFIHYFEQVAGPVLVARAARQQRRHQLHRHHAGRVLLPDHAGAAARYNTAAQLEALAYRKNFPTDPQSVLFSDWAMGQMNYLMGDNPAKWSYIVGFGSNVPGRGIRRSAAARRRPPTRITATRRAR